MASASTTGSRSAPGCSDRLARNPSAFKIPSQRPRHLHRPRLPDAARVRRAGRADRRRARSPRSCSRRPPIPNSAPAKAATSTRYDPTVAAGRGEDRPACWASIPPTARPSRASATRSASSSSRTTISSTSTSLIGRRWQRSGGQRTWTAMVFLNEPEGGGQTFFEKAGVKVTPRARQSAGLEQSGRDRRAQLLLAAPGHAGHRRGQIYHHQMVSRAAVGLNPSVPTY